MKQRSPTIEGFRVMFSRPALGLAEIAWRWTFGFFASLTLTYLVLEYFRTLPVSAGELFLLRTGHPLLMWQALGHIFQGSAVRLFRAALLLSLLLAFAWIILASWARTATVRALLSHFQDDAGLLLPTMSRKSPFGLNLLRVAITLAATLACVGIFIVARAASPITNPSPSLAMLIIVFSATGIVFAWWLLNWLFSLAAIFVVADGSGTCAAILKSMHLWHVRWTSIMAAGVWFGIAHLILFSLASSLVALPLAFVGVLPAGIVMGGLLLVALFYFAAADFLYAGKMAAYVAIAKPAATPLP